MFPFMFFWHRVDVHCFPSHLITTTLTLKQSKGVLLFSLGRGDLTGTFSRPGSGPLFYLKTKKVGHSPLLPSLPKDTSGASFP